MKQAIRSLIVLCICVASAACLTDSPDTTSHNPPLPEPVGEPLDFKKIGWRDSKLARTVAGIRAVNMGNALEAPVEGQWGMVLEERYFQEVADAGFNTVRIPVKWSAHARHEYPYEVKQEFFERIDWVIQTCRDNRLLAILNMHHYDEIYQNPSEHQDRFVSIWKQIAQRYEEVPNQELWFELLNEPHAQLAGTTWTESYMRALHAVRVTNPDRPVVLGAENWNGYESLVGWQPPDDVRLVATFHYYHPFRFTHQGAEWVGEQSESWLGQTWKGTFVQVRDVALHFRSVNRWMGKHGVPVLLGEFGAYSKADLDSRIRWTHFIAREAELFGFGWAYWEFGAGFGVYNRGTNTWRKGLYQALLP